LTQFMSQHGESTSDGLKVFCELQGPAPGEPQPTLVFEFKFTSSSKTNVYLIPPFYCRLSATVGQRAELGHDLDFGVADSRSSGVHNLVLSKEREVRLRSHFRLGYYGIETVEGIRKGYENAKIQFSIYGIVNGIVEDSPLPFQQHFEVPLYVHSGAWEEWVGTWTKERVPVYLSKDVYERLLKIPNMPRDPDWVINELVNIYESSRPQTKGT